MPESKKLKYGFQKCECGHDSFDVNYSVPQDEDGAFQDKEYKVSVNCDRCGLELISYFQELTA